MRIGDILLRADLISQDLLEKALHRQKHTGEKLGPILVTLGACSQKQIDSAWMNAIVTPAVEAAACFNRYTQQDNRVINYTKVHRRQHLLDDLLDGARPVSADCAIEGSAQVDIDGTHAMTISFTLDTAVGFAEIDDESDENIRVWMNAVGAKSVSGKLANDVAAMAAKLLRQSSEEQIKDAA
jgi:hypothetical protein